MVSGVPVFWLLVACLSIQLFASLRALGRVKELHHGYYGVLLCLVPWWGAQALGLVLLADDTYQHAVQDMRLRDELPPGDDFSPIHRLYVWAAVRFLRWWHRVSPSG